MRGLAGRAFLVTGGGSGIGRATCERLAAEGARVAVADLDVGRAEKVAAALRDGGATAIGLSCDVTLEAEVEAAVTQAVSELGGLRGLVTSAGVFLPGDMQPPAEVPLEVFVQTLAVNLVGTFASVKHAIPHLLAGGGGAIVTVASTAGLRGHGFGSGYSASKGGVIALTRLLAERYGGQRVRANCVAPGATAGEGMGAFFASDEGRAGAARGSPLGRPAEASEPGAAAAWLLSDDASFVTGQVLAVDGGASVR